MQIQLMYKKALYVFLSLVIIFANVQIAYAASPAGWLITKAISSGARTIVSATNGGYKSAVNIAPNVGTLGAKILKVGNTAYLGYVVVGLLFDGVDWVLDPANNGIKYKPKAGELNLRYIVQLGTTENVISSAEACKRYAAHYSGSYVSVGKLTKYSASDWSFSCTVRMPQEIYNGVLKTVTGNATEFVPVDPYTKFLPIASVANKYISDASSGRSEAKEALQSVAIDGVNSGAWDRDLRSGAVPLNDNSPLIPAVPGTQTGDVGTMTSGDVGAAAQSAKDAADSAQKSADAARDAAKNAADDARAASDRAKDLINSAIDQALKDAAAASAKDAAKAADDAKAVSDAAAAASDRAARDSARAAKDALDNANSKAAAASAAAAAAAADASKSAVEKAAAVAARDAAIAEAAAAKERAEAAEKAAEKAKIEAKPFELPAFCTWASVVCEYTQWVKQEYTTTKEWVTRTPEDLAPVPVPIDDGEDFLGWQEKATAGYVQFDGQCPADVQIPISFMGASSDLSLSYVPFCHFASLIKFAVITGAWIGGLMIISGGRSRE